MTSTWCSRKLQIRPSQRSTLIASGTLRGKGKGEGSGRVACASKPATTTTTTTTHFMDENPPLGYDESFVTWPFTCCTMDQMLVNTAAAMRKAVDHNTPGESYFVSNSEGTSISGYHWFGAVLQISVGGSFEDVVCSRVSGA